MSTPTIETNLPASPLPVRPATADQQPGARQLMSFRLTGFRWWYWASVPLLAIAAYVTVLRVGFLSDDFMQLYSGRATGINLPALLPTEQIGFYRPVGVLLIWQLGGFLWGYNPLPFHVLQLLIHAANSLLLGLWLAWLTHRPGLGWLAGALFAVFPLHLEAVGFIGAQFDSYSVLFTLASLWCFGAWWRHSGPRSWARWTLYLTSLALFSLAALTKESVFLFIPVFGVSAWIAAPPAGWRGWPRSVPLALSNAKGTLVFALLPFCLPIILNIALRLSRWGTLGGYGRQTDYGAVLWDNFLTYARLLLSPLNPVVVGNTWVQAVGMLSTVALLVGLTLYGREQRPLLLLAGMWIILAIAPVLGLPPRTEDLEGNRYLYLTGAGYIVAVAALLYSAIASARRWRLSLVAAVSLVMLLSIAGCWVQLRTWHTASVQVDDVVAGLIRLIPPRPRPDGMIWFAENVPARYKGVPVLLSGLGISRIFANGGIDYPHIERVPDATQAPVNRDPADAFGLRFAYNQSRDRFDIDYLAGITSGEPPPSSKEAGDGLLVWDFRACAPGALASWQMVGARPVCEPGRGLTVQRPDKDAQLIGPQISINHWESGARFVRLRVAVSYPSNLGLAQLLNEWFWRSPNDDWSQQRSKAMPIKQDTNTHVYWTFLRAADARQGISALRFDPANDNVPSTVQWIAIDLVK